MENINKSLKLKILLIFFLSNSSTYLISTTDSEICTLNEESQAPHIERKDYVKIKLDAELLANYNPNNPISVLDSKNRLIIPHGIMIEETSNNEENLMLNSNNTKEYILYIPVSYMSKVLKEKQFKIVPYGSVTESKNKFKRKQYEFDY